MKRSGKYNARKTTVDGIVFASKREAQRYGELKLLEKAGEIDSLTLQPDFPLYVWCERGAAVGSHVVRVKVGVYRADFRYWERGVVNGEVIEDVKGMKTPVYQLKKRMVEAIYGITIKET